MEKTLREAVLDYLDGIGDEAPYFSGYEALRAALDRETDRPDAEKALEEAASFFGGEWMDHAKLIESQRPHFAAWLKSRERGA